MIPVTCITETCLQYMFHVCIAFVCISCKSICIILPMKWNLMFQNFHLKYFSTQCMYLILIIKHGRKNDNFVWGMSLIWLLSKKTINFNTNAENSIWKRFYIIVNTEIFDIQNPHDGMQVPAWSCVRLFCIQHLCVWKKNKFCCQIK